jgi:hypothetical protein
VATDTPRLPPQNLDAEQSVLGAILLDNAALSKAIEVITEADFYQTSHQKIFRAMLDLSEHGEGIDQITLTEQLKTRGDLKSVGGATYLAELLQTVPSAANIRYHSKIIQENAARRRAIVSAEAVRSLAYDGADLSQLAEHGVRIQEIGQSNVVGKETGAASDPWPVLDSAAYHGLAGDIVRLIEPHTEADPVALLVSLLAEVGVMLGRSPHLTLDGAHHPLLFWPVLVGQSSKSRKGSAAQRVKTVLSLADPSWTRGECKGTLSSGEGLAYAVRDPQYREEPVKEKGRPISETVPLLVDAGVTDKRLFLVQSEFGVVLRVMAREGNSLSGVLRDAWDGLDLAPMTKAHRVKATAPHIGIVGHVTSDELRRNLTDTEASNGFGNRFVWLAVRRSKELPFSSAPDLSDQERLARELGCVLQKGRTVRTIGLTDEAREDWAAIYHDLSADRLGLAGALLARGEAQVMRLAALYALLDGQAEIDRVHLTSALALWEFAEASTRLIFGDATGDPIADTILRAVQASGELSDSQISNLFGRHVSAGRLDRAKTTLVTAGMIHYETIETGGRPCVTWRSGAKKAKEAK